MFPTLVFSETNQYDGIEFSGTPLVLMQTPNHNTLVDLLLRTTFFTNEVQDSREDIRMFIKSITDVTTEQESDRGEIVTYTPRNEYATSTLMNRVLESDISWMCYFTGAKEILSALAQILFGDAQLNTKEKFEHALSYCSETDHLQLLKRFAELCNYSKEGAIDDQLVSALIQ